MTYSSAQLALLVALLALAAAWDVALRRIPNWLTVGTALSGLAAQWSAGGGGAAARAVFAAAVVLGLGLPLWGKRLVGGGDLKLAAGAAVWVGLARSPTYLLASALAGGAIAAVCYALSSPAARTSIRANLWRLHAPSLPRARAPEGAVLVPYGAAFAAGAVFAVWL